jgi:uncharacterized protein
MREVDAVVEAVRGDPDVIAVLHYGSSARGEARPRDVDVALVFREPVPADAFDRCLRLDVPDNVDANVFQELPIYIRSRILGEARVAWCRDEDALVRIAFRTVHEFEDFRPFYEEYLEGAGRA